MLSDNYWRDAVSEEYTTALTLCKQALLRLCNDAITPVAPSAELINLIEHYKDGELHLLTDSAPEQCQLTHAFREAQRNAYPGKQPGFVAGELCVALCGGNGTDQARVFFRTVLDECAK